MSRAFLASDVVIERAQQRGVFLRDCPAEALSVRNRNGDSDAVLEQRLTPEIGAKRLKNYLQVLSMELTTLARACGKSNVHHLEREDLVALTVEAAAMAKVPLAGTQWIPGLQQK